MSLLRSQYRQNIHKHWNDESSVEYSDLIRLKTEILKTESNGSRKFYVYKRFVDWSAERFQSEIFDIENKKITLIFPTEFNDPYDCRLPVGETWEFLRKQRSDPEKFKKNIKDFISNSEITKNLPRNDRRKFGKELYNRKIIETSESHAKDLSEKLRKSWRVACFSTNPSDMYFWSHYGGVHQGYCLEYEFGDELFKNIHPVEYVDKIPSFEGLKSNKQSVALVKSKDWSQENEWRLISRNDDLDENDYNNPIKKYSLGDAKISAIYLGLDFHKGQSEILDIRRKKLLECFEGKNIFQTKMRDDEFKITAEKMG